MANTNRRIPDKDDRMFIPTSIDRNTGVEDSRLDTGQVFILGVIGVIDVLVILSLIGNSYRLLFNTICWAIFIIVNLIVLDRAIIKSNKYKALIEKIEEYSKVRPDFLWDIINIDSYTDSSMVEFYDGRSGVFVRLDRDTLIGRDENFKEEFYDSISDVYRELNSRNYEYVVINIMDSAGKDKRLDELDEVIDMANKYNEALGDIMRMQIDYIKKLTENNLYEEEILFICTRKREVREYFIDDVESILGRLVGNGYIGFSILNEDDIKDFAKYIYGVREFDIKSAESSALVPDKNMDGAVKIIKVERRD